MSTAAAPLHSPRFGSEALREAFWGQSLLNTADFSSRNLCELIELALQQKQGLADPGKPLDGKSVALVFLNPSLRTRASMCIAIQQLGGIAVPLEAGSQTWGLEFRDGVVMDQDKAEHIREAAAVLGSYVDAVGIRCFPRMLDYLEDRAEQVLNAFQEFSGVPVINLESATHHPLQGLGDMLTIRERFGACQGRKVTLAWADHPRALPLSVPNSFALAAAQCGMNLTIACPPGYELDPDLMSQIEQHSQANRASLRVVHDLKEGCRGAEVVYAKSWGSRHFYGHPEEELQQRRAFKDWTISQDLMSLTDQGVFMHCLPVRRNVVVADEVLDGPGSIVVQQAANRLHIQKTLLSLILS